MNKCLTILLNIMIWDKHAKPGGIVCLFVCIGGGIIYKQSPMRNASKIAATSSDDDEIFKADLSVEMNNDDSSTPKASEMADLLEKQSGSAASKRRG